MHRLFTASVYDHRRALRNELARRQAKNPRYSLRAFARDLRLSPAMLCELTKGKTGLTEERALELTHRMSLPKDESEAFRDSVLMRHHRNENVRLHSYLRLRLLRMRTDMVGFDKMPASALEGVWQVSLRLSSGGEIPRYSDSARDKIFFLFSGSKVQYISQGERRGLFHVYGDWNTEDMRLFTPTSHFDCRGRDPELPEPWLADFHWIRALDRHSFSLSTPSEKLKNQLCPPGESLETVWTRVR